MARVTWNPGMHIRWGVRHRLGLQRRARFCRARRRVETFAEGIASELRCRPFDRVMGALIELPPVTADGFLRTACLDATRERLANTPVLDRADQLSELASGLRKYESSH